MHSWLKPGTTTPLSHSFEDWQGLICGLVQCQFCGRPAILQLLNWRGQQLEDRIFTVGELPAQASEVFMRNMQSAYCDVTRYGNEIEALISLRQIKQIAWLKLPALECIEAVDVQPPISHPDWRNLSPEPGSWWPPIKSKNKKLL